MLPAAGEKVIIIKLDVITPRTWRGNQRRVSPQPRHQVGHAADHFIHKVGNHAEKFYEKELQYERAREHDDGAYAPLSDIRGGIRRSFAYLVRQKKKNKHYYYYYSYYYYEYK